MVRVRFRIRFRVGIRARIRATVRAGPQDSCGSFSVLLGFRASRGLGLVCC
jgi:hypothetical protein